VPDLRVGELDGERAFGRVARVAPRSGSGLWVLDAQRRRVFGFDGRGRLEVEFGREGRGPGELANPGDLVELADGRIAVAESYPPRLHWFDGEGLPLGTLRPEAGWLRDAGGGGPVFANWRTTRDGVVLLELFGMLGEEGDDLVRHVVVRLRDGGTDGASAGENRGSEAARGGPPADTVLSWKAPAPAGVRPGGALRVLRPVPRWTTGPGGVVWWTPGSPYELRAVDLSGDPVRTVTLPGTPVSVTHSVREAFAAQLRRSLAEDGQPTSAARLLERVDFPDVLPRLAGFWVSEPDGRIYAAPFSEAALRAGGPVALDAFEPDGRYLGTMAVPRGFAPHSFTEDAVYGVIEDELGVSYAARYRIERPTR